MSANLTGVSPPFPFKYLYFRPRLSRGGINILCFANPKVNGSICLRYICTAVSVRVSPLSSHRGIIYVVNTFFFVISDETRACTWFAFRSAV